MDAKLLLPGVLLALVGAGLSAQFTLTGPMLPSSPLGYVGWGLVIVGVGLMRFGATR